MCKRSYMTQRKHALKLTLYKRWVNKTYSNAKNTSQSVVDNLNKGEIITRLSCDSSNQCWWYWYLFIYSKLLEYFKHHIPCGICYWKHLLNLKKIRQYLLLSMKLQSLIDRTFWKVAYKKSVFENKWPLALIKNAI